MAGDRYVYFSLEMESLLREFQRECAWETETYDGRKLEDTDYIFRRHGHRLPMTPSTFTWRFKLILKKHGLPPCPERPLPAAHQRQPPDRRWG